MLDQYQIARLSELARLHLHPNLDTPPDGGVPADLKPGTYRWALYIYSNLYKDGDDTFSKSDQPLYVQIFDKLRDEHTICWTRDKLIAVDPNKRDNLRKFVFVEILTTKSFFALRVLLHLSRMAGESFLDDYMIHHVPSLKEFVRGL